MKYILATLNTTDTIPLEELLYGEENIISIIVNGVKGYEIPNDNILGLYFNRWELRINLSDKCTTLNIDGLTNLIETLCQALEIEVYKIEILDDVIDYLNVASDRNLIDCENIVITNNIEDFNILKHGEMINENNAIDIKINQYIKSTNKIPIFVLQSTAFGTGSHETTKQCIKLINHLKNNNIKIANALDMGTGTGILAFVIAKLFGDEINIDALDISQEAIKAVDRFASINKIQNIQSIYTKGDAKELSNKKYDLIVSNILLEPLISLKNKFKDLLQDNGYIILSGFLENQKDRLISEYQNIGFKLEKQISLSDWVAVLFKK